MGSSDKLEVHQIGLLALNGQHIRIRSRIDQSQRIRREMKEEVARFVLAWHFSKYQEAEVNRTYVEWALEGDNSVINLEALYKSSEPWSEDYRTMCRLAYINPLEPWSHDRPKPYNAQGIASKMARLYKARVNEGFNALTVEVLGGFSSKLLHIIRRE